MPRRAEALCLVVLLGLLGTPRTVVGAGETPHKAVVIRDNTPIRAGAGRSFYVVGQLSQGTQVTIEEVVFGWYKISPPQGTFSYISRAFVDAYGDGQAGSINTNRAAVRTASINGPGESYRRQIDLLKGDTVQIVSEEGSFYKIIPPNGAYVFLPPGTIREAGPNADTLAGTAGPSLSPQRTPPTPTNPSLSSNDQPTPQQVTTTVDRDATATNDSHLSTTHDQPTTTLESANPGDGSHGKTPPLPQSKAKPVSKVLKTAEKRFEEAHTLPLEDQPIDELLKTYQALGQQANLESTDQRIIAVRIAELQHRVQVADALRQIAAARENIQSDLIQEVLNDERLAPPKQQYSARGLLQASSVYNGNAMPQLFRVVEPASHRIISYIRLRPGVDPSIYVGKYVGIAGQKIFDPTLKLKLIEVDHLDVIELSATR